MKNTGLQTFKHKNVALNLKIQNECKKCRDCGEGEGKVTAGDLSSFTSLQRFYF